MVSSEATPDYNSLAFFYFYETVQVSVCYFFLMQRCTEMYIFVMFIIRA